MMPIGGPIEAVKYMSWLMRFPEHTDKMHDDALRRIIKERIEREKLDAQLLEFDHQ
jgi:hypothetical protein